MCSARVNLSCWQDESVTSESTGSRSKMLCSEMFVFCSSLLVSLTFGVSCQRSRLSEIRWLNVKQPTSTRLWLDLARSRSQVKLTMSESFAFCSSLSVSLAFEFCHRRARLCLNQRLTREFTLLEICMIYHQAEQVSQCDWTAVVKGAQHPLIGRLITLVVLPAAWRQVSTSENHQASRSREIRRIESRTIE